MHPLPSTIRRRPVGPRSSAGRSIRFLLTAITIAIAAGCAAEATDGAIPDGYPTVADERFHGVFELIEARSGGQTLDLAPPTIQTLDIDVVTGAATLDLICNRRLGSFTLTDDGAASFTFTGGNPTEPCPTPDSEAEMLALFERIDRWEAVDGGFALVGADGDRLVLTRA